MSCWVVPSVAAEMWGLPLDQILAGIADGSVTSRTDGDFLLVDVTCGGEKIRRPQDAPRPAERRATPPTFTAITKEEMAALKAAPGPAPATAKPTNDAPPDVSQWRLVRQETGLTRRRPAAAAAA